MMVVSNTLRNAAAFWRQHRRVHLRDSREYRRIQVGPRQWLLDLANGDRFVIILEPATVGSCTHFLCVCCEHEYYLMHPTQFSVAGGALCPRCDRPASPSTPHPDEEVDVPPTSPELTVLPTGEVIDEYDHVVELL